MPMNNCTPDNVFGPIGHYLFLGCSVIDFTCTAGFSEQITDVTVRLVRDPCLAPASSPKIYYDANLNRQTTTEADPGFVGESVPIIGCPAYFRVGDFEICLLIQSWERERSTNIQNGYVVKLVTPIKILQDTQLIIGEYAGPVKDSSILFSQSIANLINVYGFAEKIDGIVCPLISQVSEGVYDVGDVGIDGGVFGTAAGGFGGAGVNDNGIRWSTMLPVINVLTSSVPRITNDWSPHGRLIHKGVNLGLYGAPWTNGYGLISADGIHNAIYISEYYLDLSELPIPPDYFRFNSVNISLLEAITRLCQECGFEYFIELLPIRSQVLATGGIGKIIKVRGLNKVSQASLNGIDGFITTTEAEGRLEASSFGREFRDDITSTFLVGGPKQTVYQAIQTTDPEGDGNPANPEDDDMILPYFGTDISGNMMVPYLASGLWQFDADTTEINLALQELQLFSPLIINERELQFSTSLETWENYTELHETESYQSISGELPSAGISSKQFNRLVDDAPFLAGRDLASWNMAEVDINNLVFKRRVSDKEKIYQWISNFANSYYGKQFAVRVPYSCAVIENESQIITYSEQPTNDGGWTEADNVIGLPNGTFYTDFFTNEQNKLTAFTRYDNAIDYDLSQFSSADYIVYADDLYIKSTVQEQYVFHNKATQLVPRVVVSIPSLVQESEEGSNTTFARIHSAKQSFNHWLSGHPEITNRGIRGEKFADLYNNVSSQNIYDDYGRLVYYPEACAIPIRSNVNNYGPWTSIGPAGGIRVEKDDGLVPWQFGGYTTLNIAAQELADAGNTNSQVSELGSITVVGYPELPLGAEINSLSALGGQQLVENRSPFFDSFNGTFVGGQPFSYQYLRYDYGFNLDGSLGPSVGNITISISAERISTTYNMRTYTPMFGKFAQLNAQRLSQIGQQRMSNNKQLRAFLFQREAINNKTSLASSAREAFNSIGQLAQPLRKMFDPFSPHEILVGQNLIWRTGVGGNATSVRSILATESIRDVLMEMSTYASGTGTGIVTNNPYSHKAFMSMDGLIRPVSMGGDGGLPRYTLPVASTGGGGVATFVGDLTGNIVRQLSGTVALDIYDFNPFTNPAGYSFSDLSSRHTGNGGHDIDIVGRGDRVPSGGMILRHGTTGGGTNFDYRNDYRFMALKGPILINGWGYDTQGKPIPNQIDTDANASGGVFQSSGLSDNFLGDWLQKPHTWPIGALNVRFNRTTSMWDAVTTESEVYGRILGHLGPSNGVRVINLNTGTHFYGTGGITGYTLFSGFTNTKNIYASGCELNFRLNQDRNRYEVNNTSSLAILITGTINGGTWNSANRGIIPALFTARLFQPYLPTGIGIEPSNSGFLEYNTGIIVTGWNRYTESLTVTAGQAYIGKMINGWYEGAECETITL